MNAKTQQAATNAIQRCLAFLAANQEQDGSFASLSSPDPSDFSQSLTYRLTFAPSLILSALNTIAAPEAEPIKKHLADFLLSERSSHWSFNYWAKHSPEYTEQAYPDDLDDTFCALAALQGYDATLLNAQATSQAITLLTATEEKPGGPYNTWLLKKPYPPAWQDIDIAVNSNVAYYLSFHDVYLPNLEKLVEDALDAGRFDSHYYHVPEATLYFIARWYRGKRAFEVISYLQNNQTFSNPLVTALRISALRRLGEPLQNLRPLLNQLLKHMATNDVQPYPLYLDPVIKGTLHYAGSAALTAAFCIEALALCLQEDRDAKEKETKANKKIERIIEDCSNRFKVLGEPLASDAISRLETMLQNPQHQDLFLLPYHFSASFKGNAPTSSIFLGKLAAAGAYGWLSYTSLDNFLDNEGSPTEIGPAAVALRELTLIFATCLPRQAFSRFATQVLDAMDTANHWEVRCSRIDPTSKTLDLSTISLPNYQDLHQLAERSFGHALSCLAILWRAGYPDNTQEFQLTQHFFTHYLIARQLNDDAHDWKTDLQAGRLTAVICQLLSRWQANHQGQSCVSLSDLELFFWDNAIEPISDLIHQHCQKARQASTQLSSLINEEFFEHLLTPIEYAAQEALRQRKESRDFISAYTDKEKKTA